MLCQEEKDKSPFRDRSQAECEGKKTVKSGSDWQSAFAAYQGLPSLLCDVSSSVSTFLSPPFTVQLQPSERAMTNS